MTSPVHRRWFSFFLFGVRYFLKDSYDLIWKTLTEAEKNLVRIIVNTESKKVSDIKEKMENPNSYSVLRSRLENKHILSTSEWGKARIDLPEFKEFVNLWG